MFLKEIIPVASESTVRSIVVLESDLGHFLKTKSKTGIGPQFGFGSEFESAPALMVASPALDDCALSVHRSLSCRRNHGTIAFVIAASIAIVINHFSPDYETPSYGYVSTAIVGYAPREGPHRTLLSSNAREAMQRPRPPVAAASYYNIPVDLYVYTPPEPSVWAKIFCCGCCPGYTVVKVNAVIQGPRESLPLVVRSQRTEKDSNMCSEMRFGRVTQVSVLGVFGHGLKTQKVFSVPCVFGRRLQQLSSATILPYKLRYSAMP